MCMKQQDKKKWLWFNVPSLDTSTIPSSTQVSSHAITPEEEITPKPPEDSDVPVEDEDVQEEGMEKYIFFKE